MQLKQRRRCRYHAPIGSIKCKHTFTITIRKKWSGNSRFKGLFVVLFSIALNHKLKKTVWSVSQQPNFFFSTACQENLYTGEDLKVILEAIYEQIWYIFYLLSEVDGLIRESEEEALKRRFKREKCKKICKSMQGLASHQNSKQPKNPKGLKEVSTSITVENCLILVFNCFKSTQLSGQQLAVRNQTFPVRVPLLAMPRDELSAVITRLMSKCL